MLPFYTHGSDTLNKTPNFLEETEQDRYSKRRIIKLISQAWAEKQISQTSFALPTEAELRDPHMGNAKGTPWLGTVEKQKTE